MNEIDVQYSSDLAIQLLSERVAELERLNAILRAAVIRYQMTEEEERRAPFQTSPPGVSTVPHS